MVTLFLRGLGHDHWANWMAESSQLLQRGSFSGIAHLLGAYGGMGSFNDCLLDPGDKRSAGAETDTRRLMDDSDIRKSALQWISGLTDREFAEFFYDAVHERCTSDSPEEGGHFVLADASHDPDSTVWDVDFIALPRDETPWIEAAPPDIVTTASI